MKIAPIPPTSLLGEFSTDYHLCLAHLLDRDERQMAYYKRCSANLEHHVILDNGAYEHGCSISLRTILKVARELDPDEIVLPDVFLDKQATIYAANEGYDLLMDDLEDDVATFSCTSIMIAPQGQTTLEWMSCLESLVDTIHPDTIGIPVVYESRMGRGTLIKNIINFFSTDHYQPHIHLLGWDGDLYKLDCYARDFPTWIRGIDSAKPFYYPVPLDWGLKYQRPDNYFDKHDFDRLMIVQNLSLFYEAAAGVL